MKKQILLRAQSSFYSLTDGEIEAEISFSPYTLQPLISSYICSFLYNKSYFLSI